MTRIIRRCSLVACVTAIYMCCSHGEKTYTKSDDGITLQRKLLYEEYHNKIESWLNKQQTEMDKSVFISYDAQGNNPYPSTAYTYPDFMKALKSMSVDGVGNNEMFFYTGQTDNKGLVHGLVNIAAFLSHAMALPSIKYDLCDEHNSDTTDNTGKYAAANACGQYGRSYQEEVCTGKESMTCNVYPNAVMTAVDSLPGTKTPPPLQCKPKTSPTDFTGFYDSKLGTLSEEFPYSNRYGSIHVEGCCFWGRGVLLTKGVCNIGKLNFYLGRIGAEEKGYTNFFDIDICVYPEVICEGEDTRLLRWMAGMFEWLDRVQSYNQGGLNYMNDLNTFVNSGFIDANRFIDIVEKALPFDCYELTCSKEEEKVKSERRDNFINIIFNVLKLPGSLADENTSTNALTPEPQVENAIIEQSVSTAQAQLPTNPPIKPILLSLDNEQEEEEPIVQQVEPVSLSSPPPPPLTIMQQWPTKTDLSSNSNSDSQNDQSSNKQTEDTLIPLKSGSLLSANWFGIVAVCVVGSMIVIWS